MADVDFSVIFSVFIFLSACNYMIKFQSCGSKFDLSFFLDFPRKRTERRDKSGRRFHVIFVCLADLSEKIRFF